MLVMPAEYHGFQVTYGEGSWPIASCPRSVARHTVEAPGFETMPPAVFGLSIQSQASMRFTYFMA